MVKENKVSKYLLYAIGEIILVVIGILIALSINNWNNDKKDRIEEQLLLQNLKQEFTKNLNELKSDHKINVQTLEATYYFLETKLQLREPYQIDSLIGILCVFATFDPSIGYINQAINSGKLDLIKSDSLKRYLGEWTGELNDLQEDNIIRREHWLHHFLPIIRKHIPTRNSDLAQFRADYERQKQVSPIKIADENYENFITSLEVDGAIYDHYMNQYYVIINEEHIDKYINQVLDLINSEIN